MKMDHYNTLGVPRTASPDEIKKAYRKLVMEHHPDKGGDRDTFEQITVAYETLSDIDKRAAYDRPQPQYNHYTGNFSGPEGFGFSVNGVDISELFSQAFGRQNHNPFGKAQQTPPKPVYRTRVTVTLQDVYTGAEQVLQLGTPTGVKVITIKVPQGIHSGNNIRYENLIDDGALIIEFIVLEDLKFDRKGDDLYATIPISILDLIVGTKIEFTTMGGQLLEVDIPAGTQVYTQFRLNGHGMPNTNGGRGDQMILLKPIVPANIDNEIIESINRSRSKTL